MDGKEFQSKLLKLIDSAIQASADGDMNDAEVIGILTYSWFTTTLGRYQVESILKKLGGDEDQKVKVE